MDFFNVLALFGGLGLFLYGMTLMAQGLQKLAGGKMQVILEKLTSNRFKSLLLGAGVTAVIQSSTATTVMIVGFVNSGIMKLSQVIGIIIGANIGTTLTAWMLSLTGLQGTNFFIQILRPANFSLVFAIIGAILVMFIKKGKKPTIGQILLGLAILFFGMGMMSDATSPLRGNEAFGNFLLLFENPILGVLLGALVTGILQSSTASVGILQALALSAALPFSVAFPIILGQNIGTCLTAVLSSIGANKNAQRAAAVHLYYNIAGAVAGLCIMYVLNGFMQFEFWNENVTPVTIASIHSAYNVICALAFLPFTKALEKLVLMTIKDKEQADSAESLYALTRMLDERFLTTPLVALEQCRKAILKMSDIAAKNVKIATSLISDFSQKDAALVLENEYKIDILDDRTSNYLLKLKNLPSRENKNVSKYLHTIRDFERIGDHAENIMTASVRINENGIGFTQQARAELEVLSKAVNDILGITMHVLIDDEYESAVSIEPLEQAIDFLRDTFKERHVERLKLNECTVESGVAFNDIMTDLERIADHCSNIALYIIEAIYERSGEKFEAHQYARQARENPEFTEQFNAYKDKYLKLLQPGSD